MSILNELTCVVNVSESVLCLAEPQFLNTVVSLAELCYNKTQPTCCSLVHLSTEDKYSRAEPTHDRTPVQLAGPCDLTTQIITQLFHNMQYNKMRLVNVTALLLKDFQSHH